MTLEIVLVAVGVVAVIGEWAVWHWVVFWHSEEKRDPRNMRPPY
jgi:hypothetical protein